MTGDAKFDPTCGVKCPACGADENSYCRTLAGEPRREPHFSRQFAAGFRGLKLRNPLRDRR